MILHYSNILTLQIYQLTTLITWIFISFGQSILFKLLFTIEDASLSILNKTVTWETTMAVCFSMNVCVSAASVSQ